MDVEGDRIRVVVMGDNRVGKSAILERLLRNSFKVHITNDTLKLFSHSIDEIFKYFQRPELIISFSGLLSAHS